MTGTGKSLARLAAAFLVLMSLASVAWAQAAQTSPPAAYGVAQSAFLGASFAQAFQGREVWITMSGGSRLKARLGPVAPTGLAVSTPDGQTRTIGFADISKIEKSTHRLRNHMIAGAIIGTGLGLIVFAVCDGDAPCAGAIATYGGIGVGIGAMNGAIRNSLNRDDDLIYLAGARTTTVAVTPIVSRERQGVSFSVTWR